MATDANGLGVVAPKKKHLVILIHGIRTRAPWMELLKEKLREADFIPEATTYGWYGLISFIFHSNKLELEAIERVTKDIAYAVKLHSPDQVSVIAHSFGTYVFSKILLGRPDWKWERIIFCGSIVRDDFPFEEIFGRFTTPLLNEVGAKDRWPAIAARIGYGGVGSHGFNRPGVETRTHQGFKHSDFLTPEFSINWLNFLRGGNPERIVSPAAVKRNRWPAALGVFLIALLAGFTWWKWTEVPNKAEVSRQTRVHALTAEEARRQRVIDQMKTVQRALCVPATGEFSSQTQEAIREYFQAIRHKPTGLQGMSTFGMPLLLQPDIIQSPPLSNLKLPCPPSLKNGFEVGLFAETGDLTPRNVLNFQIILSSVLKANNAKARPEITEKMDAETRKAISEVRRLMPKTFGGPPFSDEIDPYFYLNLQIAAVRNK